MTTHQPAPLIALPACRMEKDGQDFHTIGDKYVRAVAEAAGGLPMMLPSLAGSIDIADVVHRVDGIVLTGSPSNVHPGEYARPADPKAEPHDRWRDSVTLPLIRATLDAGVPLFAICRGMQELNVALGGTLSARVHEIEGRMDHRAPTVDDLDVKYGVRHAVAVTPGGTLAALLGTESIEVNSLHHQGVETLAPGLRAEAVARSRPSARPTRRASSWACNGIPSTRPPKAIYRWRCSRRSRWRPGSVQGCGETTRHGQPSECNAPARTFTRFVQQSYTFG